MNQEDELAVAPAKVFALMAHIARKKHGGTLDDVADLYERASKERWAIVRPGKNVSVPSKIEFRSHTSTTHACAIARMPAYVDLGWKWIGIITRDGDTIACVLQWTRDEGAPPHPKEGA